MLPSLHRPAASAALAALAASLLAIGAAQAQGAQGTLTEGVITVGSDLAYPPYNHLDARGRPAGFDVELMNALARAVNMKVVFEDRRFETLIAGVRERRFDVIASTLYAKFEREIEIDFVPYMRTGISIAVPATAQRGFARPEDLCGARVASIKGAAWMERLVSLNNTDCYRNRITLREFATSPDATRALLDGEADAQIEDSAVLQGIAASSGGRVRISSTDNFYPVVVVYGIRKGNTALSDLLRRGLRRLQASGCYEELLKKYNLSRPRLAEFYLLLRDEKATRAPRDAAVGGACER
jgi:polar amino acid transport system substrate-binding protein